MTETCSNLSACIHKLFILLIDKTNFLVAGLEYHDTALSTSRTTNGASSMTGLPDALFYTGKGFTNGMLIRQKAFIVELFFLPLLKRIKRPLILDSIPTSIGRWLTETPVTKLDPGVLV